MHCSAYLSLLTYVHLDPTIFIVKNSDSLNHITPKPLIMLSI